MCAPSSKEIDVTAEFPLRLLTNDEVGTIVRTFRELMQWSQETLAEQCKVSVRTIQRIESGQPCDVHTKRALAAAFEINDLDYFNKPQEIPDAANLKAIQDEYEKEHLILGVTLATRARDLAESFAISTADLSRPGSDLADDVQATFAALTDCLRDYRDIASETSEVAKLEIFRQIQAHIDELESMEVSVCYAIRETSIVGKGWPDKRPMEVRLIYLSASTKGKMPAKIAVPKRIEFAY
jgi:transcriptional regulator with XRE-family HTH domain